MEKDIYGHMHYAISEVVEDKGKRYVFQEVVPNHPVGCDLYSEGQERFHGFCGNCGGCSTYQPKRCVRGVFKLIKEE